MNIEPLKSFLDEEISPPDLAILLNDLLDDYIDLIVDQQLNNDEIRLDIQSKEYIHALRRLRDLLIECR